MFALVNEVERVAGVTAEPIETGDHKFVAGPQELQHGRQLRPTVAAAGLTLFPRESLRNLRP